MEGIQQSLVSIVYVLGGLAVVVVGGVVAWFWAMRRGAMQGE